MSTYIRKVGKIGNFEKLKIPILLFYYLYMFHNSYIVVFGFMQFWDFWLFLFLYLYILHVQVYYTCRSLTRSYSIRRKRQPGTRYLRARLGTLRAACGDDTKLLRKRAHAAQSSPQVLRQSPSESVFAIELNEQIDLNLIELKQ